MSNIHPTVFQQHRDVVEIQWDVYLTLDSKCNNDYAVEYIVPSEPFGSEADYQKWVNENLPNPTEGVKQKIYTQSQIQI